MTFHGDLILNLIIHMKCPIPKDVRKSFEAIILKYVMKSFLSKSLLLEFSQVYFFYYKLR